MKNIHCNSVRFLLIYVLCFTLNLAASGNPVLLFSTQEILSDQGNSLKRSETLLEATTNSNADGPDLIRFKISDQVSMDEAVIYFASGATDGFDSDFDAHKIGSSGLNISSYGVASPTNDMAINGISGINDFCIPLKIITKNDNIFTLVIEEFTNNSNRHLYLYDTGKDTYSIIVSGASYNLGKFPKMCMGQFFITNNKNNGIALNNIVAGIDESKARLTNSPLSPNPYTGGPLMIKLAESGSDIILEVYDTKGKVIKAMEIEAIEENGTYIFKI